MDDTKKIEIWDLSVQKLPLSARMTRLQYSSGMFVHLDASPCMYSNVTLYKCQIPPTHCVALASGASNLFHWIYFNFHLIQTKYLKPLDIYNIKSLPNHILPRTIFTGNHHQGSHSPHESTSFTTAKPKTGALSHIENILYVTQRLWVRAPVEKPQGLSGKTSP